MPPDEAHIPAVTSAALLAGRTARLGGRLSPQRLGSRYTRLVGLLKILLPAVAVVLLALVIAWPQLRSDEGRFQVGYSSINQQAAEKLSMLNARYTGIDKHDRPYTLTADNVTKVAPDSNLVALETPEADMTTQQGTWVVLKAERGLYNQKTELLRLNGSVTVFHDAGYEFRTTRAEIDLAAGSAAGDEPVEGQGPAGLLTAEGFRILDGGDRVVFTGTSHLTLFPGAEEPPR